LGPARSIVFKRANAAGRSPFAGILCAIVPHLAWLDDGEVFQLISKLEDGHFLAETPRHLGGEIVAPPVKFLRAHRLEVELTGRQNGQDLDTMGLAYLYDSAEVFRLVQIREVHPV